jgi:hypothetical protein
VVSCDFEFRISDFGFSVCLSEATKRTGGASFRACHRVIPKNNTVEDTHRDWWRALKDPPAFAARAAGGTTRD